VYDDTFTLDKDISTEFHLFFCPCGMQIYAVPQLHQ
jgi:hypothetical protein